MYLHHVAMMYLIVAEFLLIDGTLDLRLSMCFLVVTQLVVRLGGIVTLISLEHIFLFDHDMLLLHMLCKISFSYI